MFSTAQAQSGGYTPLAVYPTSLWTGSVTVGQSATVSCKLLNHSSRSITVFKAVSSNSAYSVSAPSFPVSISAGGSANVTIRFAPKSAQRFYGSVAFYRYGSSSPVSLSLSGQGVAAQSTAGQIAANPASLNFGNIQAGSTKSVLETLTNTGGTSLTISSVSMSNSAFSVSGISVPATLQPAHSITFNVIFAPKTTGAVTGTLTVTSNASNPKLAVPLAGNGSVQGTLSISPTSANLGSVAVGANKTISATLGATNASIVVTGATTTSPEFTLSGLSFPLTIAAGQSVSFQVKFAPSTSGTATGTLSFAGNASNSPVVESLSGTGTSTTTQHTVALSWKASTSSVTGYNVYRGAKSGGPYSKITSTLDTSTSFHDSSVQAGVTYYYVVTSMDAQDIESGYSNQVIATVPTP